MRRSRHLAAAAFLLLFIFGVQNVSTRNVPELRGTSLEPKCYHFYGKVDCQNGGPILSSAKVSVMEYDPFGLNDKISTTQVYEEGYFKIVGCVDVLMMKDFAELFLEFENVCFDGQRYQVSNPIPDKFESYLLSEEENNGVILSNHPMSRPQHRRFKYPPMPASYSLRVRRQQQGKIYDCDDGYIEVPRGWYTFKGKVKCGEYGRYVHRGAEVTVYENNAYEFDYPLGTSSIKENGEYEITVYAFDTKLRGVLDPLFWVKKAFEDAQLYLTFKNVCVDTTFEGGSNEFRCPQPDVFQNLKIENGEIQQI